MGKRKGTIIILFVIVCLSFVFGACGEQDPETPPSSENPPPAASNFNEAAPAFGQAPTAETAKNGFDKIAYAGDDIPVSRALVAKMLSYIDSDKASIESMERTISFNDTSPELWYDKYINAVAAQGYMNGGGAEFMPDKPLTISQAQSLLDNIDKNNKVKIQITEENKNKAISYALWTDLYYKLLTNLSPDKSISDKFGIGKADIIILATPGNNKKLKGWNMIASSGALSYEGLFLDDFIDKKISVLKKDSEIIAYLGVLDNAPVIKNAYIVSAAAQSITVFVGGAERTYAYYDTASLPAGKICDIKINGFNAESVTVYNNTVTGVVKKANADIVELEGRGQLGINGETKIYSVTDGIPKWKTISAVTMGTDIAEYFVDKDNVCAIVIVKTTLPENIRIAINTSGFKGLVHEKVSLTSDREYNVKIGGETKTYKAGEVFSISKDNTDILENDVKRIYIEPADKSGKIQINSVTRNWTNGESPKYRGKIEIGLEDGGFSLVNETSMDEYLYAVVPSEMPTAYGGEAAKVQAVTARSYAYNQYYANRFYKYGANVDDSVSCQVYNNIPENETSISAVNATAGQCLTYNGSVISANYFSTSCGMTANTGEVWAGASGTFPGDSADYLRSVKQYTEGDYGDLRLEENAYIFLRDMDVPAYDKSSPWFRWNVEMTAEEIAASVNANIKARYEANKKLILTLDSNNVFRSMPIDSIGDFTDMEVVQRGEGGNILKLKIIGTKATVLVMTEYNIRALIKPMKLSDGGRNIEINRSNGTKVANYTLMPSSFFVIDKQTTDGKNISGILFSGGGNGHGVGMSQEGVKGMIDAGFKFDDILKHFYKGTQVKKMI